MAADGRILIDTRINSNGIRQGMVDINQQFSSLKTTLKKLGTLVISTFAVGQVLRFGKECIRLGSDLTEVQNVVDVTFTTMSNKVNEFAISAANAFGLSETMAKQYVGTFGAMAKSFGFTEQAAYEMSTTLTGLAGDVASFYNISQDLAYIKLKSVFSGETETLKDLGIVMTQNALDSYAMANGIGKTTSTMTEQEKVALRYRFVLDQLSAASGDFIRTSDGWANQVRIMQLQLSSLKATIGQGLINIFNPILKAINLLLARLATAANAFKAFTELITGGKSKGGEKTGITNEMLDTSDAYSSATESADDYAKAAKGAGKAAKEAGKEAEGALASFDKLNVQPNQADASGGGGGSGGAGGGAGGGGLAQAEEVDYGELAEEENKNIKSIWADAFDTLKQAWDSKGQAVIDSAKTAFNSLVEAAKVVGKTFYDVFTSDIGVKWVESILERLRATLDVITAITQAFTIAWSNGSGIENVTALFTMLTNINNLVVAIRDSFTRVFSNGIGVEIWTNILGIVTGVYNTIGNLAASLTEAWNTAGIGDSIWSGILNILNTILGTIHNIADSTAEWGLNLDFTPLLESISILLEALQPLTENIGQGLEWFYTNVLLPIAGWTIEEAVPTFFDMLSAAITVVNEVIEALKPLGQWLWEEFLQPLGSWAGDTIISAMETITNLLNNFSEWISGNQETVQGFVGIIALLSAGFVTITTVIPALVIAFNAITSVVGLLIAPLNSIIATSGSLVGIMQALATAFGVAEIPIGLVVAAIVGLVAALTDLWGTSESFRNTVLNAFEKVKTSVVDAITKIQDSIAPLIDSIKNLATSFYDFYSNSTLKDIVSLFATLIATIGGSVISTAIDVIGRAFSGLMGILTGAINILSGVIDLFTSLITLDFEKVIKVFSNIGTGLLQAAKGIFDITLGIGIDIVKGLLKGILDGISDIYNWFKENIFDPIINSVKNLFGIHSPSTVMSEMGKYLMEGLLNGITELISQVINKFVEIKDSIVQKWEEIKSNTSEAWENIKSTISEKVNNIKENASTAFENIKSTISEKWQNIKQDTSTKWQEIKNGLTQSWNTLKESATPIFIGLKDTVLSAWKDVQNDSSWDAIKNNLFNIWDSLANKAKEIFSGISETVKNVWEGIKNFGSNVKTSVSGIVSSVSGGSGNRTMSLRTAYVPSSEPVALPRLASGTVVPPRAGEFAAILGDNRRETEVVSPLSTMKQAVLEAMEQSGGIGGGDINLTVNLDGRVIYQDLIKRNRAEKKRTGTNPLLV